MIQNINLNESNDYSVGSVGDMKLDKKSQIIYFTNTKQNRVESYDLKTDQKRTIYEKLNNPKEISVDPKSM